MIKSIILYEIGGLFISFCYYYCCTRLANKKVNYKKASFWLIILLISLVINLFDIYLMPLLKVIFTFIFLLIICYYTVNKNLKESICLVLFSHIIIILAEFSFIVIDFIIGNIDMLKLTTTPLGILILDIYIFIFVIVFLKTKIPNKLFNYVIFLISFMRQREVIVYSVMIIIIAIISTAESYMDFPFVLVLTTNTAMALIFIFMVVKFAIAENKYRRTNDKYQVSITSLKEYEEILDKFRVVTHENKNQLLTIKTMSNEPKVINYIDAIIDEKIKDNETIMNKAYKIPDARFRSILYPKICKIAQLKIKYKFTISNEVKTADLINMDDFLVRDACTILGVYLDNAIEAVENLKEKNIFVEIYIMDGYLCFDITNNFEGTLDIDKLFKPKYTTKGKNHGYGLSLVNKIIKENDKIANECEVIKNRITQRLKIKI